MLERGGMKKLLLAALAGALTGCVSMATGLTNASLKDQQDFHVVKVGVSSAYLIDPRTETCVLSHSGYAVTASVLVSCAKLKRSLPEAAQFITWEEMPAAAH